MWIKKLIQDIYQTLLEVHCEKIQNLIRYECLYEDRDSIHYCGLKFDEAFANLHVVIFESLPYVHKIVKIK